MDACPENSAENPASAYACSSGYSPDTNGTSCVSTDVRLSTGAIAGISVAVIVVVGGLVGFLYWWFICRGKA
eukprot:XP_001707286.1 VSP, putative [Giardia lamblia ATCC 50803]